MNSSKNWNVDDMMYYKLNSFFLSFLKNQKNCLSYNLKILLFF